MLTKLAALVQSKIALAALGVALVGSGSAVAVAAATHHLPTTETSTSQTSAQESKDATETADSHAHTVAVEGVLTSYTAGAGVDGSTGALHVQTDSATVTVYVNAQTKINGDKATTLADLSKNIGHKVEVQADKQSDGALLAWKVTVSGATEDATPGAKGKDDQQDQERDVEGKVTSVGASSFVVQTSNGNTVTVLVSAQTSFMGSAKSIADLHANDRVTVKGTAQSNGSVAATSVEVENASANH